MIDNMMTQRFPSLFNLPSSVKYQFIEGDVSQMNLKSIFTGADAVIHLAAITDAAGSIDMAEELEANNFQSTLKVAEACIDAGAPLIALSSTSVYGTQNDKVDENCAESELQPQSPYANTKLKEEELISALVKEKSLKAIHCRFGTIFGISPGMRFHTAVNKFCLNAAFNQKISVYKTALNQFRPYLSVRDCFKLFQFCIEKNFFKNDIFNALSGNYTVNQIISKIKKRKKNIRIKFVKTKIMNQLSYHVDDSKIKSYGLNLNSDIVVDSESFFISSKYFCTSKTI